ncbi:LysR family transcriptional regulator [Deinococcus roseus]|uniref:LysR family transcriptional regulator n=1 Tax=Deinococcus roseus TaxID=392414 RepID=A0ABQ2D279_9DEIO|nr:LysR family transcriptional regulator [Deinococcus roseus]GGJ36453.1 LysR family transcriptional regulator [Deinococcus roseus]
MQLHQILGFLKIVEVGSFTLAAEQLEVSQSALSHAIAALEKELGVLLLERGRHGARPTEVGEKLLPHMREIVARLERIRNEASDTTQLLSGRVRLGAIPSSTVDLLPRAMAAFGRQCPSIELIMLEEPSQGEGRLLEWLASHTIDVALMELPVTQFEAFPLQDDELCAVLPLHSPLARLPEVQITDLAPQPFVLSRYSSEHLILQAYQQVGLSPSIRFEVQDLGTLIGLVREGLGISLVPRLALPVAPEGIALVSVVPRIQRQIGFVVRSVTDVSPAVKAFIERTRLLVDPA